MVRPSRLALTGAHYGLKDWLAQRVTAVLMAIYLIVLAAVLLVAAPQDYAAWKAVFSHQWLRIATLVFFIFRCHTAQLNKQGEIRKWSLLE